MIIILVIVLLVGIIFFPYIKAEVLTFRYGKEFEGQEQQTNMMNPATYHKVVDYSDGVAKVCYVARGDYKCLLTFTNETGEWKLKTWETIWSATGSADELDWLLYW